MKVEQPIIRVFAQVSPDKLLNDHRCRFGGQQFGTIEAIASQYGIEIEEVEGGCIFSAPRSRIQMLIEKLHFSRTKYLKLP